MPIRVQLEDQVLDIDVDPNEWKKAVESALSKNEMIRIENSSGEVLGINPQRVLFWTEDSQEAAEQLSLRGQVPA